VNLDEIKALGSRLAELCRKYGIAELAVFGSVVAKDGLHRVIRDQVLADAQVLYAA
jgi:uncharacterized protein